MNAETLASIQETVVSTATDLGIKVLAAIAFWVIGRWLIGVAVGMVRRALEKQKVDPTVLRYVGSIVTVTLNILLVIGILGYFGFQTTTFAALIAAAGIAIGAAWAGLLANFAAGAFIIVLRPFRVGDFVTAGGVTGTHGAPGPTRHGPTGHGPTTATGASTADGPTTAQRGSRQ